MPLPPTFDPEYYLAHNRNLAITSAAAAEHYRTIGRVEGLVASPLALRENLIALIDDGRGVLEIGPFCRPLLTGPRVAYLDVLNAEQLRARAGEIGLDPAGCPATIDYVGGLELVDRRFDAVVSSHAIEHQPDLIAHLQHVERILTPDGLFCLIIPDKRYCLDHYIAESTIAAILQAHREERRVHGLASVVEHIALTTHNDMARHWAGDHGPIVPPDRVARIVQAVVAHERAAGGYVDVHAWYFTPDSFRAIVETMGALGLVGLEVGEVYDTARDRNEFCAILRLSETARRRAEARIENGGVASISPAGRRDVFATAIPCAGDRWAERLNHRDGLVPELVMAPPVPPKPELMAPILDAWRAAGEEVESDFARRLSARDADSIAEELAALGRSPLAEGLVGGARQHARADDAGFAEQLARWTQDRLVSLAEVVGAIRLENPERGDWNVNAMRQPRELFAAIAATLGADLSPPPGFGGQLGLAVGSGQVVHIRMLDAIYNAWRLRQLSEALGLDRPMKIVEIGGGAGLTAFYAHRLGLAEYRIFDRAELNAVQSYVLTSAGIDAAPAPLSAFALIERGSADLLFNADSLPDMPDAVDLLVRAHRAAIPHLLSINQEAALPGSVPVGALVVRAGGYRPVGRQRYWLRSGYVEEQFMRLGAQPSR